MEQNKMQVFSVFSLSLLLFVSIGSDARAGDAVRVFLMAGQSNMEGNNTTIPRLEELICHANSDFTLDGMTCGSTEIEDPLLTKFFLDNDQPLNDYYDARAVDPNHPVAIKLGDFLCTAGKLTLPGENCGTLSFDLTDRFFATVSGYYYHEGNQQFQWGYNAFKEMSAAVGVADIHADGYLTADLLTERSDVTVLQFRGSLASDGTLSLSERSGLLAPGFGAAADGYGPELIFGHYMGDLFDDDVLLLKVVQGGTDLRVDWKTPCSTANTGNELTPEELAQDSLYDALIAKAMEIQNPDTLAQYFPQYAGKTAQIAGFVWFQGWNDGLNTLNQTNYETNLRCLLNDLRSDLGQPTLPVVIAQSHVGEPDNPVQAAQAVVAADFDNTELAITDDLSGYYHYDNAAQLVIGQRMAAAMTSLLVFDAVPPLAHDQQVRMRAAEFVAKPITLAATPANDNPLSYAIVSGPSNGSVSGMPPHIEYLPDSTFTGQDSFTFTASHAGADSNIATVTIDVIREDCTTAQIGGPADGLFLHVPSHMVTADISPYEHAVLLEGEALHESASSDPGVAEHVPWVSRNDLTDRNIVVDLDTSSLAAPLSISFKLMPSESVQDQIIMQSVPFVIEQAQGTISSTFYYPRGVSTAVANTGTLKTRSCNHVCVVIGDDKHIVYLNGEPTEVVASASSVRPVGVAIVIGPYPGKVWDIRVYERTLSQEEILELGGADCSDALLATSPDPNYPNYLCGVYVREWWPDGTDLTMENYQYYLAAQDSVYERNFFEGGMYPRDNLCDYFLNDSGRNLMLSEGIRNSFVRSWDFSDPLKQSNGQYWLHENFHSFQGRLAGYLGRGGSKFLLESTASWGADHQIPAVMDTLLGYYTMHPHLPLWTIQNSPVDERAGHEFKGGHQYGAYIFWSYLTNHIVGKSLIGDIFNDTRAGSRPAEAAYDLLALQGHDMKPIFADFAARITTWDIKDGAEYADAEEASLRRMRSAEPDAETHDNKITAFYDSNGTGNEWTAVPEQYIPGSWAFNAYKVDVNEDVDFILAVRTDLSNPVHSDFQARVVVCDEDTGQRSYHTLNVLAAGEPSSIKVSTRTGDELYLVVATTPDIFSGWDWYSYEFMIYPDRVIPPVAAPTNLSAFGADDQVVLDWDDNTEPNLIGYNVYRTTTSGTAYARIATEILASEYIDSSVIGGTEYYYVVTAVDTDAYESDYSNEASATPIDTVAPAAPMGLSVKACGSRVNLNWEQNTEPDLAGYNVYRSTSSGSGYVKIAGVLTASTYTDQSAAQGWTYYYVVTAVDLYDLESGYSNEVSATNTGVSNITCGLMAYWPFDGSAKDLAGSNDGTLIGGASYVAGKFGQAVACSNHNTVDYVALDTTSDGLSGAWTAAAWVYVHTQDVAGFLDGWYDTGETECYGLRVPGQYGSTNNPGMTDYQTNKNPAWNGSYSQTQAYETPAGAWTLLVFVGTDTECELFADGVSRGKIVYADVDQDFAFKLAWDRIGNIVLYQSYGGAVIDYDEVAIWDRTLDIDEIAWLYNGGEGNKIMPTGDLSLDGLVNFDDFARMAGRWRQSPCDEGNDWCGRADLAPETPDGVVNGLDLAALVDNWLAGAE